MKYIVNDPSFDLVSDQHTAAQWVLSAATGIERLAGGMSLAYIARLRDAWAEIERLRARVAEQDWMHERITELVAENDKLRAELAKRPKLWTIRKADDESWVDPNPEGNYAHVPWHSEPGVFVAWAEHALPHAARVAERQGGTVVEYTGAEE